MISYHTPLITTRSLEFSLCLPGLEAPPHPGRLKIILVFAILNIAPFISDSFLGNTPITMVILQKYMDTF